MVFSGRRFLPGEVVSDPTGSASGFFLIGEGRVSVDEGFWDSQIAGVDVGRVVQLGRRSRNRGRDGGEGVCQSSVWSLGGTGGPEEVTEGVRSVHTKVGQSVFVLVSPYMSSVETPP